MWAPEHALRRPQHPQSTDLADFCGQPGMLPPTFYPQTASSCPEKNIKVIDLPPAIVIVIMPSNMNE